MREDGVSTPFGPPSGPVVSGRIGEREAAVLAAARRAGTGFSPSEINYRANVFALKTLGGDAGAVDVGGRLAARGAWRRATSVLVDQFIDRPTGAPNTFFGDGVVGHVGFAEPACSPFAGAVAPRRRASGFAAAPAARAARRGAAPPAAPGRHLRLHGGAAVLDARRVAAAPQLGRRRHRHDRRPRGQAVREAELCFAALALVTDYDCWHAEEEAVTVAAVVEVLQANVARRASRSCAAGAPRWRRSPRAAAAAPPRTPC